MENVNREKVISILNDIMKYELAGVVRYTHSALMVVGPYRESLITYFNEQSSESLTHAQSAGDLLVSLGGHPSQDISIIKETNELLLSNDSKVSIELTKAAKKYIADNGFEPSMGARPLKRLFEDVVKKPISKKILFDKIEEGIVLVDYIEQFEFTVK